MIVLENDGKLNLLPIYISRKFYYYSKIIRGKVEFINSCTESINEWLRKDLSDELYLEIVVQILLIVITLFDPEMIVFVGKKGRKDLHESAKKVCTISKNWKKIRLLITMKIAIIN